MCRQSLVGVCVVRFFFFFLTLSSPSYLYTLCVSYFIFLMCVFFLFAALFVEIAWMCTSAHAHLNAISESPHKTRTICIKCMGIYVYIFLPLHSELMKKKEEKRIKNLFFSSLLFICFFTEYTFLANESQVLSCCWVEYFFFLFFSVLLCVL